MMAVETWLAFALASAVLLAIPGPTVLLVVAYALGQGRRAAAAVVAGVALGDFTAMTASLMGLGVLLATSAALFTGLKLAGAAYLVYLGIRLWRAPVMAAGPDVAAPEVSGRHMLGHAWLVTALNPKSIVFFIAFLPQFLDASRPLLGQMILMEATFVLLATLNAAAYAWLATSARRLVRRPAARRLVNRAGAACLIAAGLLAIAWPRAVP